MEKHTTIFKRIENHFKGIERCSQYHDIDISAKAFEFWLDLEKVNTEFRTFGSMALLYKELQVVQGWLEGLLNNHEVPKEIRERLTKSKADFASMVESINKSRNISAGFNN